MVGVAMIARVAVIAGEAVMVGVGDSLSVASGETNGAGSIGVNGGINTATAGDVGAIATAVVLMVTVGAGIGVEVDVDVGGTAAIGAEPLDPVWLASARPATIIITMRPKTVKQMARPRFLRGA